jgi:hypothetical protein
LIPDVNTKSVNHSARLSTAPFRPSVDEWMSG